MSTIPIDIEGLNLVLGGGVTLVKRAEDLEESATLLVRGPPGSGKTILGLQLATSLARSLGCDVAYGCVELLPSELKAQHEGIKRSEQTERVVWPPFLGQPRSGEERLIFAGVMDLGTGREVSEFDKAVFSFLDAITAAGGAPRILVIDSLSDGYNLGAAAPRLLADALCKLAVESGMVLVLLEETTDTTPSAWSFACDIVFELGMGGGESGGVWSLRRELRVLKSRFGPSIPGPHQIVTVSNEGVRVLPSPAAYLAPWAVKTLLSGWESTVRWDWLPAFPPTRLLLSGFTGVLLVRGNGFELAPMAAQLGQPLQLAEAIPVDILISLRPIHRLTPARPHIHVVSVSVGLPLHGTDQILADVTRALFSIVRQGRTPGRLFIGDLSHLLLSNDRNDRVWIQVLVTFVQRLCLPVVLLTSIESLRDDPVAGLWAFAIDTKRVSKASQEFSMTLSGLSGEIGSGKFEIQESELYTALLENL